LAFIFKRNVRALKELQRLMLGLSEKAGSITTA
jgi:hypothetical protein